MAIKLGRKRPIKLEPFTGKTFCGCHFLNGDLFAPCGTHLIRIGRHRND